MAILYLTCESIYTIKFPRYTKLSLNLVNQSYSRVLCNKRILN